MNNHSSVQLSLPLKIDNEISIIEYQETVKQNWQITFSKQHFSSVFTKRVMGLIAAQIEDNDEEMPDFFQISANKIIRDVSLDKSSVYKKMKEVMKELVNVVYYIRDEEAEEIIPRHLIDTTRYKQPTRYSNGVLTLAFNPQLKKVMKELSHFSNYELNRYLSFSSWYSMRLYEILSAYRDFQEKYFPIDDFRDMMGCGLVKVTKTGKKIYEKYPSHSDAIKKTTAEPLKDFKGTWLEFEVISIYAEGIGRGRRPICGVKLVFKEKRVNIKATIKKWVNESENFAKLYKRLISYEVSDRNIYKYAHYIGEKYLGKELVKWDQKMQSKNPIVNKQKYCNKSLRDMGEKLVGIRIKNLKND